MNRKHSRGNFEFLVTPKNIEINGTFKLQTGEAAKINSLLGIAMGMKELPVLPPSIGDPPFTVGFSATGDAKLSRSDNAGFVHFKFSDVDDLVVGLTEAINIHIDNVRIKGPQGNAGLVDLRATGADTFEGR